MRKSLTWTTIAPIAALLGLGATWGRDLPTILVIVVAGLLGAAVLAAVHHAEVIAHKVGEPFGSLLLAVAVTVIEVGLIVTLMLGGGDKTTTLARDTVFAAVMITCNGIVGLSLLIAAIKSRFGMFNPEGTGGALATVIVLAGTCLVLPTFTSSASGPEFSGPQLAFAAVASLALYLLFVSTQTVRHRDFFLPVGEDGKPLDEDVHAQPPTTRETQVSLALLLFSLVAVVGLAKVISPALEHGVAALGMPQGVVGVVIALVVLAPESLAAANAARRGRTQVALNLAYGSAMASIGLTIPALAVASIWLDGPLHLGLGATHLVLLSLTVVVGILTIVPGRATRLQAGVHLVLLGAYLFLTVNP
ncbi:calcium:cation antiporter [Calidifontibacter terrae]